MATPNYDINYNDERFTEVEADKKAALNEVDVTYGNMISQADSYYQKQIDAAEQYGATQAKNQQAQTDFAIEKIEQQKEQTQKDYIKEQSGAYVDWQKQSNQYGVNAEQQAAQGMQGTGFSESSQVAMYNQYQHRVATAREVVNRAMLEYDNAIKDAQLQNNSILAEIAYNTLKTKLELSLKGFQHKNQLLIEQSNKKMEVDNNYYNRYKDVLNQINTENALAEEVRQYDTNMAFKEKEYEESVRQFNAEFAEEQRQFNKNYNLQVKELNEEIRQFDAEIARLKAKDANEHKVEIQRLKIQKQQAELAKQELAEKKRQFNAQLAEEKRQFNANLKNKQATIKKSGGGSGGSRSSGSSKASSKGKNTGKAQISSVNLSDKEKGSSSKKSSGSSIDMGSVLALGYGPISASRLSQLVKQGLVEQYQSGGKTKFRKSAYTNKQAALFK